MYLIVGLGNPGSKYFSTRHNIGFIVIDKLAEFLNIETFTLEGNYLYAEALYNEKQVVLFKPLTYMNASGNAVKEFYDKYEVQLDNTLIIYDDINLDFGVMRLRPSGSDGGQNGIKSVIYELETDEIPRLRVGIGNKPEIESLKAGGKFNLADYVLSEFTEDEFKHLDTVVEASRDAVLSVVDFGLKESMNRFNKNFLTPAADQENKDNSGTPSIGENNN